MGAVPKNYRHIWKYLNSRWSERKNRKGLWTFRWSAIKKKRSNSYGSFGKGTKGAWDIRAKQYIEKIGKGKYKTTMIGTKRPLKFYVKKPKRRKTKW